MQNEKRQNYDIQQQSYLQMYFELSQTGLCWEDFKGENQVLSTFQPNIQSQIGLFPKVWKFLFPLTICLD